MISATLPVIPSSSAICGTGLSCRVRCRGRRDLLARAQKCIVYFKLRARQARPHCATGFPTRATSVGRGEGLGGSSRLRRREPLLRWGRRPRSTCLTPRATVRQRRKHVKHDPCRIRGLADTALKILACAESVVEVRCPDTYDQRKQRAQDHLAEVAKLGILCCEPEDVRTDRGGADRDETGNVQAGL